MGVRIPAAALEHQYMVTEPMKEIATRKLPTLRDPDLNFYLKPEVGGFAVGGWEMGTPSFHPERRAVRVRAGAAAAEHGALRGDRARHRRAHPEVRRARAQAADQRPDPGLARRRADHGAGDRARQRVRRLRLHLRHRRGRRGGARDGEWIVQGYPEMDLWPFDLRRFGDFHSGTRALHERAVHAYGSYYHLHYPGEELTVARDARRSPLWQILKDRGAVYGSKFGWERPNWFGARKRRGPAEFRGQAELVRRCRRRAPRHARARRAVRSDLVHQVRGHRARAPSSRCSAWRPTTWTSPTAR